MYINFIRYMRGSVTFKAEGVFLERFINLAASNNLRLWDIRKVEAHLECVTVISDYKELAKCAKKAGVLLRIAEKKGFPFFIRRYKKRWGILAGVVVFLVFMLATQRFVWKIEVNNYDAQKTKYLIEVLEGNGLHVGSYIPNLDLRELQQQVLIEIPGLSWVALNLQGTKVTIELSEKVEPPQINSTTPCNVVAKKTGQILYMETYNGQSAVKLKDVVYEGDLLVSGMTQDTYGNTNYVHADAKVMAQTLNKHTIKFALHQTEKVYTGKTTNRHYLNLFGVKIPLFIALDFKQEFELEKKYDPVNWQSSELPMGLYTFSYTFYETEEKSYTMEQAQEIIKQGFADYEEEELKDVKVVSSSETQTQENDTLIVTREYTCEENIAQKKEFYMNE